MTNYREKILEAIEMQEVKGILQGKKKYRIEPPSFVPDVFPTDIPQVLGEYFYKQSDVKDIQTILENTLIELTKNSAGDLYVAVLFFDAIIFLQERGFSTFQIDASRISSAIKSGVQKYKKELSGGVTFQNGLVKKDPMKVINQFSKRYEGKNV